jgi:hypothetical protein
MRKDMKKHALLTAIFTIAALMTVIAHPAEAQEMSDADYVDKYFGCQAVFFSTTRLISDGQYWSDTLPSGLVSDSRYIAGLINAQRMAKDSKPLLDPDSYPVTVGWENPVEGGYEYHIDFNGIRPSEAEVALATFGGPDELAPGATMSFRPLRVGYFYKGNYDTPDGPLEFDFGADVFMIDQGTSVDQVWDSLGTFLQGVYGDNVVFDMYVNSSRDRWGGNYYDVSITVEILEEGMTVEDSMAGVG